MIPAVELIGGPYDGQWWHYVTSRTLTFPGTGGYYELDFMYVTASWVADLW